MAKNTQMSSKSGKKTIHGLYSLIAVAVGCSPTYARMVIKGNMGTYKDKTYTDRDNELTRRIWAKKEQLESVINPNTH